MAIRRLFCSENSKNNCTYNRHFHHYYIIAEEGESNLDNTVTKIYWELNWLHQSDPRLIKFIKNNILIPPRFSAQKINLSNEFDENQPWKNQGTHGEALVVERIYALRNKKKISRHVGGQTFETGTRNEKYPINFNEVLGVEL